MPEPLLLKIDVTKLDKELFFRSERSGAVYLDVIAWPNRDGVSEYGDTHCIRQSRPKDDRERQMPIVGNARPLFKDKAEQPQRAHQTPTTTGTRAADVHADDDIPF